MFTRVGFVIVVLAAFALTTPASPVQISYVYSDSMEPIIGQNDGYVIVPVEEIDQRTIVVFWSEKRDEYVTHRVVGRSEAGLITKGDNNDVSDQAAGYPHVQRGAVVGKVLTVGGEPVTIDGLGELVSFAQTYRFVMLGGALVLIGSGLVFGDSRRLHPQRSLVRVRDVMHPVFAAALIGCIVVVLTGAAHHELTYVAVNGASGNPNALTVGNATAETIFINATSLPLTYRVVSTDGMSITNSTRNASAITADVRIPAPTRPGVHPTSVDVYRYPAVLPRSVVEALHRVHPSVAACATLGLSLSPFALLYGLLFDGNTPLRTVQSRWRRKAGRWAR